jgi:hypothetical protein
MSAASLREHAAVLDACDEPFPPSAGHLRWQAEVQAAARERDRELAAILERIARGTHTGRDVERLAQELDLPLAR